MGQPEQSAGASGQTREKKSRRSRKKGQKPGEKASDKQVSHPENDRGEGAAAAGTNATKGRRKKDKAGATQAGQQLNAGKSAEAPPQDGGPQTFDGPGRLGEERNGTDHGGSTGPAPRGEAAPDQGAGPTPAAEGDSEQHEKVEPDQKRRRNKKSKESKLLVYRRLGEYMPEEDEKKLDEVLTKKGITEIDDKSKMAAEVDGRGDVASVVQSPATPPTGALATGGDSEGEGEDTYYNILAQIQETVDQAAETLSDPTAEGEVQVEVEDSPSSFEDILKFAAAMESADATTTQDESPPPTPATTDADGPPQVQDIPEVPTSRITTTGTGEVSSSSSSHPKDRIDVDTAISHVAEKEPKVPNAGEDMEDDAKVQDAETLEDMSSDRGDNSPQTEVNANDTGVTENEPKSTEELHSAGSSAGMEESCEESNIPAPPESFTSEVKEINTVEVTPEQDTSEDEPLPVPSAEDPSKEEDGEVGETTHTETTTPAVEVPPVISTAEVEPDPVTPAKSEDDTTEAVNEEDLLLNAEEGEAIAINLPRHLSEEVQDTATESDMGNKSAKQMPDDEQPASKQEAVDDATGVFDDDVADISTMSPDNQSNLPSDVPANPTQTSEDEIEVEVTVSNETPDTQENAEEEDPIEAPNYTPPPPTDSADPAVPVEEKSAQPKQKMAIVIGKVSTLPDDIPYIDDVDEPNEESDTEAHADETTPLNIEVQTAPLQVPKVAEEEALIETTEPTREDEPSTTPEEKPKKKKKRSKFFSCMFPCVQPPKEKNH
ncbi:Hypp2558 [Branchiostoma lanceolatum]|uniref:Hypp2558 protein n=1 Tax=Branchiostoma lanceolatum TaxID=7740 RepID=A0A8J9ZUT8_BRALA|nr:Hypp2558 [Branchiostoma lanceolatum]